MSQLRKQKWSGQVDFVFNAQEQIYLKILREQRKMKSWKEISQELNRKFHDCLKSAKQCRQKYINYTRFVGAQGTQNGISWSSQDDKALESLYDTYGSTWSKFTLMLANKSQNCIKNRFYNRIKKLSKRLDDHRLIHNQQIRGTSTYDSLIRILDFSNQVKALSQKSKLELNLQNVLFKARAQILNCCFNQNPQIQIGCQKLCSVSKKIKEVNIKIRCFGICKAKNRKNWKLQKRGLNSSLQFDQKLFNALKKVQNVQQQIENVNHNQEPQKETKNCTKNNENNQNAQMHQYYPYLFFHPFNYLMMPPLMQPYYRENIPQMQIKIQAQQQSCRIIGGPKIKQQQLY